MDQEKPLIVLTNDDGINSQGLWAAAEALSSLGSVCVVAPREQATSAGRSHPKSSDGIIREVAHSLGEREVKGYAVGASPAQCLIYALRDILNRKPDLVVSGINYGANTGIDITRSGTIGAALEAANYGIKALAVSLETDAESTFVHQREPDFSAAAHFTRLFAKAVLASSFEADVQAIKVEVPSDATLLTPWDLTCLSRTSLYIPTLEARSSWDQPGGFHWEMEKDFTKFAKGSDGYAVFVDRHVAVTPLSMDMTSRVDLVKLTHNLGKSMH